GAFAERKQSKKTTKKPPGDAPRDPSRDGAHETVNEWCGHSSRATGQVCVLKTRFGNSGDEGRRGPAQIRCGPRAGWRDGSERPCRETDESSKPLIVGPRR